MSLPSLLQFGVSYTDYNVYWELAVTPIFITQGFSTNVWFCLYIVCIFLAFVSSLFFPSSMPCDCICKYL